MNNKKRGGWLVTVTNVCRSKTPSTEAGTRMGDRSGSWQ